jgi:Flp pilus assembly protein TadD
MLAHWQAGRFEAATAVARRILLTEPDEAEAHHILGAEAHRTGRHEAAIEHFRAAVALSPAEPNYHASLSVAQRALKRMDEAIESMRAALRLNPRMPGRFLDLGGMLAEQNQNEMAMRAFERALALMPGSAPVHANIGEMHRRNDRFEMAEIHCRRAIELDPSHHNAFYILGIVLNQAGRVEEAIEVLRQAVKIDPAHAPTRFELAECLLALGRYKAGWEAYESRKGLVGQAYFPTFPVPEWRGQDLAGKTILVYGEQGYGDTIQFSRYLPEVKARGATVIWACSPEVTALFRGWPSIDRLITQWKDVGAIDYYIAVATLPMVLGTDEATMPAETPYIHADPERVRRWEALIGRIAEPGALKVGIAWAGRPTHGNDRNRSMTLAQLAPIAEIPEVQLFSIQKGPSESQLLDFAPERMPANLSAYLRDFGDTAAAITQLDLVLCVDTSLGHLAGAMGKPVWVMVPRRPDWRWLEEREDTPWYPTMRLFRQARRGDWPGVVRHVRMEMERLIAARQKPRRRRRRAVAAAAPSTGNLDA